MVLDIFAPKRNTHTDWDLLVTGLISRGFVGFLSSL